MIHEGCVDRLMVRIQFMNIPNLVTKLNELVHSSDVIWRTLGESSVKPYTRNA